MHRKTALRKLSLYKKKLWGSRSFQELDPRVKLWIFRLLVPLGGYKQFFGRHRFDYDEIAEDIGLGAEVDGEADFDPKKVKADLFKLYKQYGRGPAIKDSASPLRRNIARLAKLVNLSPVDCQIIELISMLHTEPLLEKVADLLGDISTNKMFRVLSVLFDVGERQIRKAMSSRGILMQSGMVSIDEHRFSDCLKSKIEPLSHRFVFNLSSDDLKLDDLLEGIVNIAPPPELKLSDYRHIDSHLKVLFPFLQRACAIKRRGVNVLFHGAPGTGKTQLARSLSKKLGLKLFEIASEDENGDVAKKMCRIKAYQAAQCFLARSKALILFDEVEDILGPSFSFFDNAMPYKASFNRFLDTNVVPTFWIANQIGHFDNAFIRRFDMCIEVPVPPQSKCMEIIRAAGKGILDESAAQRLADSEVLAPALITRMASVVKITGREFNKSEKISATEMLVNGTLEAQGHRTIKRHDPNRLPEIYDSAFVNADMDLKEIEQGLRRARAGRLCFYGPSGTGKTAYARWLARQLDRPLLVKRASDLMSKWLGKNEKNIARAFHQAEQEDAILLIDEVDNFLRDRRGAERACVGGFACQ